MGGHVAGEVASRVAVEAIEAFIQETAGADKNRTWPFPFDPTSASKPTGSRRPSASPTAASRRAIADSQDLRGMATTASAVLVGQTHAVRRARRRQPRLRAARRRARSRSPTIIPGSKNRCAPGTLTPSAARQHPWRNVVTRALSGGEDPEVDVTEVTPAPGERYLLCSDGLFAVVADAAHRGDPRPARACRSTTICRSLVEAANEGGGPDNITTLVLEIDAP